MRYCVLALGLAAVSGAVAAQDQASAWGFFEEGARNGASVRAANGSQLVLKCDKPGRREVHAIVLPAGAKLAAPTTRPISRPITFRFDGGAPRTESWGFFETYAIAQGKSSDRALPRFLNSLRGSSRVHMRFDTGIGPDVEAEFEVAGAAEAIAKVYESCKDSAPT